MRTILIIIRKEFLQIKRNRQMLPMIFLMPIVQLILLVYAATLEINNVNTHIIDNDNSQYSRELISKFSASDYFTIVNSSHSEEKAIRDLDNREAKLAVIIPRGFEKDIVTGNQAKVQLLVNAEDGSAAGMINSYASNVIMDYNKNILTDFRNGSPKISNTINMSNAFWYNPELDYKQYMAPGILVVLVTFIGMFLTGMSVVKEKEIGTIEQLNVTPIKKYQFLFGKLIPFWLIGLFELAFGLALAKLIFDIPILGNVFLLLGVTAVYLLVPLGGGLLISTFSDTQQQSMFISWFFAVIFILMSGLFTPIDSMPDWAQTITLFNPIAHFVEIIRRILLKGSGFYEVLEHAAILAVYGFILISAAVLKYKKVS